MSILIQTIFLKKYFKIYESATAEKFVLNFRLTESEGCVSLEIVVVNCYHKRSARVRRV